jgi:hypothetical protein
VKGKKGPPEMGYKDEKIAYEAIGMNVSMYVKVKIQKSDFMRVCSNGIKEGLKHAIYFIGKIKYSTYFKTFEYIENSLF